MVKRKSNPEHFRVRESATFQDANVRLDRAKATLHGVKILGWKSVKNRRYERDAVEQAIPLYNGAKVNLNHAPSGNSELSVPNVDVQARFGRLRNVHVTDEGLYGDLKYNPKHAWAGTFEWFAENEPDILGFSHDALLSGPLDAGGDRVIRAIPKVYSVDLVADPGSTRGLHESAADTDGESGGDDADASLDMHDLHALTDSKDEPDECYDKAAELVFAIVKDKALSKQEKRTKVLAALNLMDDEEESDEPEPKETDEDTEEMPTEPEVKAKESVIPDELSALRDQVAALSKELDVIRGRESIANLRVKAKDLCTKAGLPDILVTPIFVDQLVHAKESAWEEYIADRKLQTGYSTEAPVSATGEPNTQANFEAFKKFALSGSNS